MRTEELQEVSACVSGRSLFSRTPRWFNIYPTHICFFSRKHRISVSTSRVGATGVFWHQRVNSPLTPTLWSIAAASPPVGTFCFLHAACAHNAGVRERADVQQVKISLEKALQHLKLPWCSMCANSGISAEEVEEIGQLEQPATRGRTAWSNYLYLPWVRRFVCVSVVISFSKKSSFN